MLLVWFGEMRFIPLFHILDWIFIKARTLMWLETFMHYPHIFLLNITMPSFRYLYLSTWRCHGRR